jgi:hypothetical protein
MRSNWYKPVASCIRWSFGGIILLLTTVTPGLAQSVGILVADSVVATSVPSNATPDPNETISVVMTVDLSALPSPNNRLAAYQTTLKWDPAVLQFINTTAAPAPWNTPNLDVDSLTFGYLGWNDFVAGGTSGKFNILNVNFKVIGAPGTSSLLDLHFVEMTSSTFISLLNVLKTIDGKVTVRGNDPPVLAAIADQTMNEGATLNVAISATDPENGKITFSTLNLPAFGSLVNNNNNTATITFTPGFNAAGVYSGIGVIATDDGAPVKSDTTFFKLTVANVNRAPVLAVIADQTMNEGTTLNVAVSATDPDNDKVTFIAINSPAFGTVIDNGNNTATFRFSPSFDAAGVYPGVGVIATDNGIPLKSDTTFFRLTVNNVNRAPQITPLPAQISINEGVVSEIPLSATDADGDSIKLSAKNLPAFAALFDSSNGRGRIRLTPGRNDSGDYLNIVVFAKDNGLPSLSDSTRFDLKVIDTQSPLVCNIEIVKPIAGATVCDDTIEVCVSETITGAIGSVTKTSTVNGVAVPASGCVKIPIVPGTNKVVAKLTVQDAFDTCVSADSITVSRRQFNLNCNLTITAPADGGVFCSDSVEVKGTIIITGGVPLTTKIDVNGVPAVLSGSAFAARIKLNLGGNEIIATGTLTDSCGIAMVCRDTIRVQSFDDKISPTSVFTPGYKSVTGTFFDNESGIAKIEPLFLFNAKLTVDPFNPGDKEVNFRLDDLGEAEYLGFDILITDMCGNTHICDPVSLELTADRANKPYVFTFRSVDRYFHVKNKGLTEIRVELNGKKFSLLTGRRGGVVQSLGIYSMPVAGETTIDLQPYLRREGDNDIRIEVAGPAGAKADLLLIDNIHEVEQALALQEVPMDYELTQNYPNPFNPETLIRFSIPADVTAGTSVQLRIYNMLGELVRTLVDQPILPGRYSARWNGRNDRGVPVAGGVYIYRIVAGDYKATKRMLLLK